MSNSREERRLVYLHVEIEGKKNVNRFPLMTWMNDNWFESYFYFRDLPSDHIRLKFTAEGNTGVYIKDIQVFSAPDVVYREFDHGLVIANPSESEQEIAIAKITKGGKFSTDYLDSCVLTKGF